MTELDLLRRDVLLRARAARMNARHRARLHPRPAVITATVQFCISASTTTTTAAPEVTFHNATGRPPFGATVWTRTDLQRAAENLIDGCKLKEAGNTWEQAASALGMSYKQLARYRLDPDYEHVRAKAAELGWDINGQKVDADAPTR